MEGNQPGFQFRAAIALLFPDDVQHSFAVASGAIAQGTRKIFVAGQSSRPHVVLASASISTGVRADAWQDYNNDGSRAASHPAAPKIDALIRRLYEMSLANNLVPFTFSSHTQWDCTQTRTRFGVGVEPLEEISDACTTATKLLGEFSHDVATRIGTVERPFRATGAWLDPDERVITPEMDEDFAPILGSEVEGTLALGIVTPRGELIEVLTGDTRGVWKPLELGRAV